MDKFDKICYDIKTLKIQGAENIAKAGVEALKLKPTQYQLNKLLNLRPTEPTLRNAINYAKLFGIKNAMSHLKKAPLIVATNGNKLIKDNYVIYTHCHSSTVMGVFSEAKKTKNFIVNNTETRPLFQGRLTALDLARLDIKNNYFIDSAMRLAIKHATIAMLGCDSITASGKIINKIGSELAAEVCYTSGVPLYIITDSWKYDPLSTVYKPTPIEERSPKEIWNNAPKTTKIHNFAFEQINPRLVTAIVSEFGIHKPKKFIKLAKKALS